MKKNMEKIKVAIIGVGLIGGSLGMALRRSGRYHVAGIGRHRAKLLTAKRRGAVDLITVDLEAGVRDADIVVVCTPVDTIASLVKKMAPLCKRGAVITDAGSVKGAVVTEVRSVYASVRGAALPAFVGAHPMAGLEKNGVSAAEADLYKKATVVIAGTINALPSQVEAVKKMWRCAGGRVCVMSPADHDAVVALTSHVPHVAAYGFSALAESLRGAYPAAGRLMAGSFRDMTRVAAAQPGDWACICRANRREVQKAIEALIRYLTDAKKSLSDTPALEKIFQKGHRAHAVDR